MIDASRLSAFFLASTPSLTASPAVTASAGDASAAALAAPGQGPSGFAQWLAAWTPEAAPVTPTGAASESGAVVSTPALPDATIGSGPRAGPWVRTDLPNVLSTLPPADAAGRRVAAIPGVADSGASGLTDLSTRSMPSGSPTPVMPGPGPGPGPGDGDGTADPMVGPAGRLAGLTRLDDVASARVPDDAAGVLATDPVGDEAGPVNRDDAAPATVGPGLDATVVAAWLWTPPPSPVSAAVVGTGAGGARNDAGMAATLAASVSFGPMPHDGEGSAQELSPQGDTATFGEVAGAAVASPEVAGLAMTGLGTGPAPVVHPAPSAAIEVVVATPVMAQRFGDEVSMHLAQHVSRMTGETQEVVLHLHPAEMGPVSVGIELRGGVATVEFGAAQALTRQQLEQSLPALAQALRDEGLTLGQGLVHDRPASGGSGQRRRGENQFSIGAVSRTSGRTESGADEVSITPAPVLAGHRSRIDLTA